VVGHLSVARIADALGVAWNVANDAVLAESRRVLISDPARYDRVRVIGFDEHVWRHTRKGDKYVTVIIDLTSVRDRTGRLLDIIEGRATVCFQTCRSALPSRLAPPPYWYGSPVLRCPRSAHRGWRPASF